jgi:toluene monooxygenase electron transfer component
MHVQVNARNRAYRFEIAAGEKILYAGLRAQTGLPYECATGTCGTCKAKLIDGTIDDRWPGAPGKKFLKAERGEFLMCQCAARGDVCIEVASFVYPSDPGACRVAAVVNAPGVYGMRGYSMVNFEQPARRLEILIRKKPGGGFSDSLFSGKAAGSRIEMLGTQG